MHHAGIVVWHAMVILDARRVTLEVVLCAPDDVLVQNADVIVTVRSRLLVMETNRVTHFVDGYSFLVKKEWGGGGILHHTGGKLCRTCPKEVISEDQTASVHDWL